MKPKRTADSTAAPTGRDRGRSNLKPWRPGESGNPRGRGAEQDKLRSLCRTYTPEAVATLADIMRNARAPAAARIAAAAELLNRGWGRPVSEADMRADELRTVDAAPEPRGLTDEQVREIQTKVLGIPAELLDAPSPPR